MPFGSWLRALGRTMAGMSRNAPQHPGSLAGWRHRRSLAGAGMVLTGAALLAAAIGIAPASASSGAATPETTSSGLRQVGPTPTPTPSPSPTPSVSPSPTPTPTPAATPDPTPPAAPAPTQAPAPTAAAPDFIAPQLTATPLTRMRSSLVNRGLKVIVAIDEPGSVSVAVKDGTRQLSRATSGLASLPQGGSRVVTVQLTGAGKARARRTPKIRWTVEVQAYDGRGNQAVRRVPFTLG